MISTRNLEDMPDIQNVQALSQSLAMLDAILCPEWEYRYYSFNAQWNSDEMMASMRDGSGDSYYMLFSPAGAILKGFAHEAPMTPYAAVPPRVWPGVLETVPHEFAGFLTEPAFVLEETTFCIWRTFHEAHWRCGTIQFPDDPDPDGSATLLAIFDYNPHTYHTFAETYYECSVSFDAVVQLYNHQPLTEALVAALNPDVSLADVSSDQQEIGYPL